MPFEFKLCVKQDIANEPIKIKMIKTITKFDYHGVNISFEFADGNKMINATEMAKPFGKRVSNFLRLQSTKDYIVLLESRYSHLSNGVKSTVLRVVHGGLPEFQGTWMDEKLALKFAAWLAPEFELWVYDRIHELLTKGKITLKNHSPTQNIVSSIRLIANQLESQEHEIENIKIDVNEIRNYLSDIEAKITSIDENYYCISGYCSLLGIDCPLDKAQQWGLHATNLSHSGQVSIGKAYDSKYGEINTYHKNILDKLFNSKKL